MTCSPTDFICQAQSAILTFLAIHWEAILLGLVAVLLVLFAPLKFKFLGALVLFIVSLKDGAVVIDYQIVPRIFLKLLEVKP